MAFDNDDLRRHPEWGQSVYLFSYGKGFKCGSACTVSLKFGDGPEEPWAAFAPETGTRLIMAAAAREPRRVLVRFVMLWVLPRVTG